MALPLLSETRTWTGHWWLPEDGGNKVPGVLTYEPGDGLTLRMIGGWQYRNLSSPSPGMTVVHAGTRGWPVVFGEAENKRITLLRVQTRNATTYLMKMSDAPDQLDVFAGTALIGCHLDDEDEPVFVSSAATIENMTAWSNQSAIENRMTFDQETNRFEGGEVRYNAAIQPQKVEFGGVTAQLHHLLTSADFDQTRGSTAIRVVERSSVEFSSPEPRPLREWLDMLSGMNDLMSLSTLLACSAITLQVWTPATPEAYPEDHPLRNRQHEINVYEQHVVTPDPAQKGADQRRFVLTLKDLPFADLIPRWMEVKDQFASARSMILGLSYITGGYLETQVVTAVGAAESFHRALNLDPPMPEDEFKALRKTLLEAVPKDRKPWLADRLMHNAPSLRERLFDLARRPGEFMAKLVPDAEKWAREATRARNGLAHDGRSDEHTFEDLHAVVEVTRAVVVLNMLHQLGVPTERLATSLSEHPVLTLAVQLARDHYPASGATT